MQRYGSLLLLGLLLSVGFHVTYGEEDDIVDVEEVEEEKAFLILRKSIVERENLVKGIPFAVDIEIHNAGSSSALEVSVEDSAWPAAQFKVSSGSPKYTSPRVKSGATAKYTYEVTPLTAGYILASPAIGTYKDLPDATEDIVVTSSTPHVFINSSLHKYKALALRLGTYVSFGSLRTSAQWRNVAVVLAFVLVIFGGQSVYKSVTDAQKKNRYQKALEEVNKYK